MKLLSSVMKREGGYVEPSLQAVNAMLSVFAAHSTMYVVVERALQEMSRVGFSPDVHTYNSAIISCKHTGDFVSAGKFFSEMRAHGVTPDAHTWNSLLTVLGCDRAEDDWISCVCLFCCCCCYCCAYLL